MCVRGRQRAGAHTLLCLNPSLATPAWDPAPQLRLLSIGDDGTPDAGLPGESVRKVHGTCLGQCSTWPVLNKTVMFITQRGLFGNSRKKRKCPPTLPLADNHPGMAVCFLPASRERETVHNTGIHPAPLTVSSPWARPEWTHLLIPSDQDVSGNMCRTDKRLNEHRCIICTLCCSRNATL